MQNLGTFILISGAGIPYTGSAMVSGNNFTLIASGVPLFGNSGVIGNIVFSGYTGFSNPYTEIVNFSFNLSSPLVKIQRTSHPWTNIEATLYPYSTGFLNGAFYAIVQENG